ncbi:required for excision 1-B domain-containing protein isoform X2 [Rhinatrema bivittatum]|nr:required for excision 1-B domain-containing protein isoform X2 [Rhinatrema bivittatum]
MSESDFKALVQRLYTLQAERVEAYRLFQELAGHERCSAAYGGQEKGIFFACRALGSLAKSRGHQAYLSTGPHYDFIQYRQLVHEITLAFSGISKEVIQMKDRFHEVYGRPDLSEHIEKVQEKEKEKLELTAKLQIAKQNMLDHPGVGAHQQEVQELKHK